MKYLFGPVPSRRLGISLGVDLVPYKTCSLNCIYCEVGKTNNLTTERKEYFPSSGVIRELDEYLRLKPVLDYITFSGQGEPTLNSSLGQIINYLKDNYPQYRIAIITNGTLFRDSQLRQEILRADLVLPSLDAVSDAVFEKINRPANNLSNSEIIKGLIDLRKEFSGKFHLEIFLVPGLNDGENELKLLKDTAQKIAPDMIQLNTLDRPGTEDFVLPVPLERLTEIKKYLEPLPVEIIAKTEIRNTIASFNDKIEEQIMEVVKRRPCTDHDLAKILNLHLNELNKYLSVLLASGRLISVRQERGLFFKIHSENSLD